MHVECRGRSQADLLEVFGWEGTDFKISDLAGFGASFDTDLKVYNEGEKLFHGLKLQDGYGALSTLTISHGWQQFFEQEGARNVGWYSSQWPYLEWCFDSLWYDDSFTVRLLLSGIQSTLLEMGRRRPGFLRELDAESTWAATIFGNPQIPVRDISKLHRAIPFTERAPDRPSPLCLAILLERQDLVRELIRIGARLDRLQYMRDITVGNYGPPLILAITKGSLEITQILLQAGAKLKANSCKTALHLTLQRRHQPLLKLLLHQAKKDQTYHQLLEAEVEGETALMRALKGCHLSAAKYLIQAGADIRDILFLSKSGADARGIFFLTKSSRPQSSKFSQSCYILIALGANQNPNSSRIQLLSNTVGILHATTTEHKVECPTETSSWISESTGQTQASSPLRGLVRSSETLLDLKNSIIRGWFNLDTQDGVGEGLLMTAVMTNRPDLVDALLATGKVNSNVQDVHGHTPLTKAAWWGYELVTKVLLAHAELDPGLVGKHGWCAYIYAILSGNIHLANLILQSRKLASGIDTRFFAKKLMDSIDNVNRSWIKKLPQIRPVQVYDQIVNDLVWLARFRQRSDIARILQKELQQLEIPGESVRER